MLRNEKILVPVIIAVIAAVAIGFDGFYTVGEQEQAVITMFGSIVLTDYEVSILTRCTLPN